MNAGLSLVAVSDHAPLKDSGRQRCAEERPDKMAACMTVSVERDEVIDRRGYRYGLYLYGMDGVCSMEAPQVSGKE